MVFAELSKRLPLKSALLFSALGLQAGQSAWAAAPLVVTDAQVTLADGFSSPQGIAISKNGTIYIVDTGNNRIVTVQNGVLTPVSTPALNTPSAIAFDSTGDLFIADTNNARVVEVPTTGPAIVLTVVPPTSPIAPIALTVDAGDNLYIGDMNNSLIYKVLKGTTVATPLAITLPATTGTRPALFPGALTTDSAGNLYIADEQNPPDAAVYKVADTGGAATDVSPSGFTLNNPTGLAFDAAGNFYILSLLGSTSPNPQIVKVPASDPSNPFLVPVTGLQLASGLALDQTGNMYIPDATVNDLTEVHYGSAVDLGLAKVNTHGPTLRLNYEFNGPLSVGSFSTLTQGDSSDEVLLQTGGTCTAGPTAQNLTPFQPFTCSQPVAAQPRYVGLRISAVQLQGSTPGGNGSVLTSTQVYSTGLSGASVVYPLQVSQGATGLKQPQGLAISGLNNTIYVTDAAAATVYYVQGLAGTTLRSVFTGAFTLQAPTALALDGQGTLYIADFSLAEVIAVPTTSSQPAYLVNTGGLLTHPISLALDKQGNLFIGDGGTQGINASAAAPGYIVEVPVNGTAAKLPVPSVPVVFPQALTVEASTGDLLVGDGGDGSGNGQVVRIPASGASASALSIPTLAQPTGLAMDAAGQLYVLDSSTNAITVVPPAGGTQYALPFDNTGLSVASNLAVSAGGQSFVLVGIGNAANSLLVLNGLNSTLAFPGTPVNTRSQALAATVSNIGNQTLTLGTPYLRNPATQPFAVLDSSTCLNALTLLPASTCDINAQFSPTVTGNYTEQLEMQTDAYAFDVSGLTFTGAGTSGPAGIRQRRFRRQ